MKALCFVSGLACCAPFAACTSNHLLSGTRSPTTNLGEFYLPQIEVHDATLESALAQIESDYAEIARKSGGGNLPLKISVQGKPDHKVSGKLQDISALGAIGYLAAQAGLTPKIKRGKVVLTRIPGEEKPSSGTFRVSPTFLQALEKTARKQVPRQSGRPDITRFFREQGFITSPTARVSYDKSNSTIRVLSSLHDQHRLTTILDHMGSKSQLMLRLEITRATFAQDPEFSSEVLSSRNAERWVKKARKDGAVVQALPSVTARPRQTASIEIVREWSTKNQRSWLGSRASFHLSLYGSSNETRIAYERRLMWHQGKELPMVVGEDLSGDSASKQSDALNKALEGTITTGAVPFRAQTARVAEWIPNGYVLLQRCSGSSKHTEFLLIKVTRIKTTES